MFSKFNQFIRSSILAIPFLIANCFVANAQTPIPGHAGKIANGTGGALLNNPNSVFVLGNHAFVAGSNSNALEIIDVSDASSPTHTGSISDGSGGAMLSNPVAVFVSGNYAYVASAGSNALEIVDVTDRTNPVHIGSLVDGAGGALLNSPSAVYVLGTTAYVVSSVSNSLEIIDVTDPSAPAHLGSIVDGAGGALLSNPLSVFVSGTNAFVASAGSNALEIIDVTDPANPFHKGSLVDGGGALLNAPASLVVSSGYAFVASSGSDAIEIVDVNDPTAPTHKSSLANGGSIILGSPQSVYLQGSYLYVASNSGNALEIVDVTDPASPLHLASLTNGAGGATLASPTSVFVSGSLVFVTSSSGNALEIINLFTPLPPTAISATGISENSFTANWTAVSNASSFEVDVSTDNFSTFVSGYNAATASGTSLIISGLTGCTDYQFKVRGVNADGTSTDSNIILVTTTVTTPVALAASAVSQTGFTANWNSISCATGYYLDVATDNAFSSILSSYNDLLVNGTSQSVTGLNPATTYYYRVRSNNASGSSSNSNTISTLTITDDPVAIAATLIAQTSFTANWNSVAGASGYHLDVATDNAFSSILPSYNNLSVAGTSQSVIGLSAGTTYYYRVRSSNASGTSSSSNTISALTITADPVAIAATLIAQTSFTANWNSVAGASGYHLDVATDNAFSSILPSYNNLSVAGTSQSVIGLSAGTTYYYRVRSSNASGTSSNSNTISALTITADPVAIAATSIAQTSFTANWNSVAGASGYHLDVATDNAFSSILSSYNNLSVTGTSQSVTVPNAGTMYYYRVRSSNSSGTSSESNTISTITIPDDPTAIAATSIGQTSFTANWNSITGASGYHLDVATDNVFSSILSSYNNLLVSGTSQSVTSLNPATTYYYRVRSTNASGTSSNSNTISALTITADPVAVAATSITQTSFTSNWNSVTGASGYHLDVATDNAFGSILSSYNNLPVSGTSQSVSGLTAGTTYYYRVRSSNLSGTSLNSNTISEITIPATPTATSATLIAQTSFTANWNPVSGASDYRFDVATDNIFSSILPTYNDITVTGTSQSVMGLNPATTYYYRVRSNNAGGTSPHSFTKTVLTITDAPVAVAATSITQTSFIANWNSVTGASVYHLDVATDNTFSSILSSYNNLSVSGSSQSVIGLSAGTTYYYRIRSGNPSGTSSDSNVISIITIPGDPVATAATSITQSSFTANWNSVTGASGYNLDVATDVAFSSILTAYNNFSVSGTSQSVTGLTGGTNYYYRLRAKNASGVSSNSNPISLQTNQVTATQNIPTLLSGGTLESYSMFSVPLAIQSNDSTISTLFTSQGEYTPDKWRLLRWNSAASNWDEYQHGLSTIDRGKSYWFNSVSSATIPITGAPFAKSSFALHLNSGWNQIGSPYDFDVSWTDVLAQNSSVTGVSLVETSLYKYVSSSKSFDKTDNLKAWGGGYVFNAGSVVTLKIPITVAHAVGGRISAKQGNQFTNAGDWFLPLKLSVNEVENNYSGIGMHAEANSSYDKFDGITVPRFLKYLELNSYHTDFFEPNFTRDVVATAPNHNWHFTVESNLENQNATLAWDKQFLGDDALLILFDPATGSVVDMKQNDHYSFKIQAKHPLHFFYATGKENLKPDITTLTSAYPNPVSTSVTFPVFIANSNVSVQLEIYDNMGKMIRSIVNSNKEQGLYMEQWDCSDTQGARVAPGMYIYRFVGDNNLVQTGKLIVK